MCYTVNRGPFRRERCRKEIEKRIRRGLLPETAQQRGFRDGKC